jgi:hypothetical protein
VKCETSKSRKQEDSFRYRELEVSKHFITEIPKRAEMRNAEISRNRHINKEFHRPGNNSISEFQIPGDGGVKTRDSSSQES